MARRHHGEPGKRIGIFARSKHVEGAVEPGFRAGELRGKFLHHIWTHFVAASTDAGANRGDNFRGPRGKFHLHATEHFCGNAGEGAAPSGVNGGDGAMARINEQDGDAVGGLDGEEQAGRGRGDSIAFRRISRRFEDDMRDVGMDLLQGDERRFSMAERARKTAAIFLDALTAIPIRIAEIQDLFRAGASRLLRFENASAAGTCAEAVNEPVKLRERKDFEDLQASRPGEGAREALTISRPCGGSGFSI